MQNKNLENNSVGVENLTWDVSASQRGLERAAQTVSTAVERAANRNAKDTANAVSRGTDRIVAAVAKINNDENHTCNSRTAALHAGLNIFCDGVEQVSEYIRRNPNGNAVGYVTETVRQLEEQLDGVVEAVDAIDVSEETIKHQIGNIGYAIEKLSETRDWVRSRFPVADSDDDSAFYWSGQVNNAVTCAGTGRVFDSFGSLYNSQNGR